MSSSSSRAPAATRIDPATRMGTVRLTVSDLSRARSFYERVLGLSSVDRDDGTVTMGAPDGEPLVELHGDSNAPSLDRRATGLFHLAILMPSRRDLAVTLARLAALRWPLDGASDHLVSEALYVSDPDGNGIEIYRDRPRSEWQQRDGELAMATLPLDLDDILAELSGVHDLPPGVPEKTTIGHVHLQVSDLDEAERFYSGVLGFEVMVRGYPGALFVAAGGYHHHLGLNIWHSGGSSPPAPGAIGLREFEVVLPDQAELARVLDRLQAAGLEPERRGDTALVSDPSGNRVALRSA